MAVSRLKPVCGGWGLAMMMMMMMMVVVVTVVVLGRPGGQCTTARQSTTNVQPNEAAVSRTRGKDGRGGCRRRQDNNVTGR